MKKIIRLTESDLARIVKRTINEMEDEDFMKGADRNWKDGDEDDDYKDRSMHSPYYGDDEEWGERDMGEESLQDLIEEARDILENELGFSIDAINEMDEFDIVDALHDHMYDELAYDIEHLMEKEGFYSDEEYEDEEDHEEELEENWDDFTQKKRYPKGHREEDLASIPKNYFKVPRRLDYEGTIGMPKKEEPFDDYEDFGYEDYV